LIVDEVHDCHLEEYALTCVVAARVLESNLKEAMQGSTDSLEKGGETEKMGCYARMRLRVSNSEVGF